MRLLQRLCPHWFGWSYNTHRRRRWCRVCAQQQRLIVAHREVIDETHTPPPGWVLGPTEVTLRTWVDA